MPVEIPPKAPPSLPKYLAEGLPKQDVTALSLQVGVTFGHLSPLTVVVGRTVFLS